ncbi:hypothetical protein ACFFLS_08980 [Flavobacterium procerum]|uniref:Uncharacterized protein n=1 Tax=Flavobacterium procerum TaxID=1455569 RepID=A0ABV6BSZ1_9FLAO
MKKIILTLLLITNSVFSQDSGEKRDTMFLFFNTKFYKNIKLSKTETKKELHYRYIWSTDSPVNSIELVVDTKRSKVKVNREKIWAPNEKYGISWFEDELKNTKVIYIVEKINNKEKVKRVLKVNPDIVVL